MKGERNSHPGYLPLELRVRETIRRFGMLEPGESILVALSGGADSTALLHCLYRLARELSLELSAAHLNHGIRGAEADADAEFSRRLAEELGIPFVAETADLPGRAAAAHRNLEESAREARYEFLRRTAERVGAGKIATGHNLDDQAETMLMRLLRGSGPEGLAGIHPVVEGRVIRPLLECSREEILRYLESLGVSFRTDSTNRDPAYLRNRVRHELIPYLKEHFNPRLARTLAGDAEIARQVHDYLDRQARAAYEAIRKKAEDSVVLDAAAVLSLHPALRRLVVRLALRESRGSLRGISQRHVFEIVRLCEPGRSGRRVRLPGGNVALRSFDQLLFRARETPAKEGYRYTLAVPGTCEVPEAGMEFVATIESGTPSGGRVESCHRSVRLDPALAPKGLTIRSRLPGDRYGGERHRKVKKLLIDAGIPLEDRAMLPMVVSGDAVVWIPGFEAADSFTARAGSDRSVLIEARKKKNPEPRAVPPRGGDTKNPA